MAFLHRRGLRGYVTLNTLAFPSELPAVEDAVRALAQAGVDALLVQDLGVLQLVRAVCPDLSVHAFDANDADQRRVHCRSRATGRAADRAGPRTGAR